jgi:membrane-associated phospholipid phosphatase
MFCAALLLVGFAVAPQSVSAREVGSAAVPTQPSSTVNGDSQVNAHGQLSDRSQANDDDQVNGDGEANDGQVITADQKPPTPVHTGIRALFRNLGDDYKHLWSIDNGIVAAAGGGAALAVHPLDATFNVHLRSHYTLVNTVYAPAKYYGDTPEQVALSLGTYAFGRIFDKPKAAHLGMDLLRAQILSESLVEPLKFVVRRERPDQSNHQSFPSGHASATFAAATIIERHLGWKKAALGYGIAAYVATSRLHDNVHYLSDVVFGSAVGTIAGRTVTQHGPNVWTLAPAPVQGGYGIFITRAEPR